MGIFVGIGDDQLGASDARLAWEKTVHAQKGVVTAMPAIAQAVKDKVVGQLAARYPKPEGGWRYELAPLSLRLLDNLTNKIVNPSLIVAGKAAEQGEKGAQAILNAPRDFVSAVTGIPRWLIPAVLLGGGALYAMKVFGISLKKGG